LKPVEYFDIELVCAKKDGAGGNMEQERRKTRAAKDIAHEKQR
jgi:hypothetical protein